jgi:hypothetical protein
MSKIITVSEIRGWLSNAPAGEAITYFRGFLALATAEGGDSLGEADRCELVKVGECLWKAAQHDRVHLVQTRYGVGDYGYVAIARGRRLTTIRDHEGRSNAPPQASRVP